MAFMDFFKTKTPIYHPQSTAADIGKTLEGCSADKTAEAATLHKILRELQTEITTANWQCPHSHAQLALGRDTTTLGDKQFDVSVGKRKLAFQSSHYGYGSRQLLTVPEGVRQISDVIDTLGRGLQRHASEKTIHHTTADRNANDILIAALRALSICQERKKLPFWHPSTWFRSNETTAFYARTATLLETEIAGLEHLRLHGLPPLDKGCTPK